MTHFNATKTHAKKCGIFLKMLSPMLLHDKERFLRDFDEIPTFFQVSIIFDVLFLPIFEHFDPFRQLSSETILVKYPKKLGPKKNIFQFLFIFKLHHVNFKYVF